MRGFLNLRLQPLGLAEKGFTCWPQSKQATWANRPPSICPDSTCCFNGSTGQCAAAIIIKCHQLPPTATEEAEDHFRCYHFLWRNQPLVLQHFHHCDRGVIQWQPNLESSHQTKHMHYQLECASSRGEQGALWHLKNYYYGINDQAPLCPMHPFHLKCTLLHHSLCHNKTLCAHVIPTHPTPLWQICPEETRTGHFSITEMAEPSYPKLIRKTKHLECTG